MLKKTKEIQKKIYIILQHMTEYATAWHCQDISRTHITSQHSTAGPSWSRLAVCQTPDTRQWGILYCMVFAVWGCLHLQYIGVHYLHMGDSLDLFLCTISVECTSCCILRPVYNIWAVITWQAEAKKGILFCRQQLQWEVLLSSSALVDRPRHNRC